MKTRYRFIHFVKVGSDCWHCLNNKTKAPLLEIEYYKPWKQFVSSHCSPPLTTVFSADCHRDIAHFLDQLNKEKVMKRPGSSCKNQGKGIKL